MPPVHFKGHAQVSGLYIACRRPEMEQITSPVVRRAVAQTIKVVNGIIREMDASPAWVRIELARELSKTFGERRDGPLHARKRRAERTPEQELRDTFHRLSPTGRIL